jgi:hypothetical protein
MIKTHRVYKIRVVFLNFTMKKAYLILFLINFSSFANNCNDAVKEIYQNIITSIGNNSLYPPELYFSDETIDVASMSGKGITIEQKAIDLFCGKDNFADKIAYIIAHELAHYYLEHSWTSNTGLSYASSIGEFLEGSSIEDLIKTKKRNESQADLYAGFYGQIAGYNTLGFGEIALTEVYESYKLPKELKGYPSFDERIEILNSRIKKANNLALLFELGNVFLKNKNYNSAKYCFEFILKSKFNSREIYNNLGLSYLLYGISISEEDVANLLYPVYLDEQTRANISKTRSGNLFKDPKAMISMASKLFNKALFLDSGYLPAKQNLLVSMFLDKGNLTERTNFLEQFENDIVNKKIISDLKVINALLANVKLKRVRRMAKSGSYISNLNITKNDPIKISQDHDNILNILGVQIEDLFFIDSKNVKGTDITISEINNMKLYQYNGVYIFALDKTYVSTKEIENSNDFIKTKRGLYYVYNN